MLVPLYGFVKGDSMGVVVLVHDHQTIRELCDRLQRAAAPRVPPTPAASLWTRGRLLRPDDSVARAELHPLDRVDLVPEPDGEEVGRR